MWKNILFTGHAGKRILWSLRLYLSHLSDLLLELHVSELDLQGQRKILSIAM